MKTIPCKSCGKATADNSEICPHCGYRRTKLSSVITVIILAVGLAWMLSLYLR